MLEGYRGTSVVAFGDPIDKANASGNVATFLSGFIATGYKNPIGLTVAGVLDGMAGVALVDLKLKCNFTSYLLLFYGSVILKEDQTHYNFSYNNRQSLTEQER